jgi:PAS domain S-box-containing protein
MRKAGRVMGSLRRSELRYRRLFETAHDGILILDPKTRKITDANPYITRLLGYSQKQLLEKELWEIGLLKDEAANRQAFLQLREKGLIRYENLPLRTKTGKRQEVEFVSNVYREGRRKVIQCNIRDVTERKKAEEAVRASDQRFRTFFELEPVGVYSCDNTGRIIEFNKRAVEMWGREPNVNELSERFCGSYKLYQPDGTFMPADRCPMADVLSGKIPEAHDLEVGIERPDGSRITAVVNIVPLKNDQDETVGAINCFYDISRRKLGEEALSQARAQLSVRTGQLEKQVTERTYNLAVTNKRLKSIKEGYRGLFLKAQNMQEKLRELTRQIIVSQEEERKEISRELHDVVVQSLVGINVDLLALSNEVPADLGILRMKLRQTRRLVANSVTEIHDFARKLRPSMLDDLGLIPALNAYCKTLAKRHTFKIQISAIRGVEGLGDTEQTMLYRVAQAALSNVARHARASRIEVKFSQLPGAIRMEISDDGKSFPVEKTLLKKGSRHLGLIGMRERVDAVGGSIRIESTPRAGTSVRVEIPLAPKKRDDSDVRFRSEPAKLI